MATAERLAAIAAMRQELAAAVKVVRAEREAVVDDMRDIVEVVLLRVALFVVVAVALAPLVAHVYVRVWPRRSRDTGISSRPHP